MQTDSKTVLIGSDLDIVTARSAVREIARDLGFSSIDQARIAAAVSELARNIFLYAGTGSVSAQVIERPGQIGIEIVCEDQGPGIANIEQVMRDGYSTSYGMGMGLSSARRLMDEFSIRSKAGIGTRITCRKWR